MRWGIDYYTPVRHSLTIWLDGEILHHLGCLRQIMGIKLSTSTGAGFVPLTTVDGCPAGRYFEPPQGLQEGVPKRPPDGQGVRYLISVHWRVGEISAPNDRRDGKHWRDGGAGCCFLLVENAMLTQNATPLIEIWGHFMNLCIHEIRATTKNTPVKAEIWHGDQRLYIDTPFSYPS